jgi:hydrogenase maturation protease
MPGSHLLVLGVGDVLHSDDGVGVEAARRLLAEREPGALVRVVDGGPLGLGLLGLLTEARDVIVVGALHLGARAGTLVCLDGDAALRAFATGPDGTRAPLVELFAAAARLGRVPRRVVAVGVVPLAVEAGAGCSPAVARVLPLLCDAVVHEARALGYRLPRRGRHGDRARARRAA